MLGSDSCRIFHSFYKFTSSGHVVLKISIQSHNSHLFGIYILNLIKYINFAVCNNKMYCVKHIKSDVKIILHLKIVKFTHLH